MKATFYRLSLLLNFILLSCLVAANSFSSDNVNSKSSEVALLPIGIASLACITVVVLLCVGLRNFFSKICPDNSFKDLETDDAFFNDIAISTVPAVSFPMYPPVVNSSFDVTAGYNAEQVYFEPLPDLSHRRKSKPSDWSNLGRVRPKIAQLRSDRLESTTDEDFMFDAETRRKIEKIFSSSRSSFPHSQLQYIKELGAGWFGKVLQGEAHDIQPGKKKTKVIVMMLKEGGSNVDKSFFLQEAFAYREIENANVLKMFHQCVETTPLLTVLEFCQYGDMKSFMLSQKGNAEHLMKQGTQLNMLCDVAAGLQCLHQHNYVHRDLAMRNCLVTSDLGVKIGDYGLSEQIFKEDYYRDEEGVGIPVRWLAPESLSVSEVVRIVNITKEANVWTFGVIMWELLRCGDLPYSDLNDLHVLRLVAKERVVKLLKPNVAAENMSYLWELMEMCWKYEASSRPSVRELRIMLLHLLSNKHQPDFQFFEEKWNRLKPRPPTMEGDESVAEVHRADAAPPRSQPPNEAASRSFPILTPLENELSLTEEMGRTGGKSTGGRQGSKKKEDAEDELSHPSGTEDGFEILSVGTGSQKKSDDVISIDRDKFSLIQSMDVDFSEGDGAAVGMDSPPDMRSEVEVKRASADLSDLGRSPNRPNFVDLSGPGSSSYLAVTPGHRSDSRSVMDEFSPMAPLSDSSLLKMDKYSNYLHTAVTSMENDDSYLEGTRTKTSSELSLPDNDLK